MNSLGEDASRREVLGPGIKVEIDTYDETNRRVVPSRIIRELKRKGGRVLVGLVGVQSNQFPRAFDIAREFRDAGFQVCMGGFHVSGCIAMLPEMPAELKEAQALGISLFAGEAEEHRLDEVLLDAWNGALKPLYNFMDKLPSLEGEPAPILPRKHLARTTGHYSSIDLGRGCPYQCSFCTIINVQGRKSSLPHARRPGAHHSRKQDAGHRQVLHHRRQFRPQQRLGNPPRPSHQAPGRGYLLRLHHSGRYALPQDSELHRKGDESRGEAHLHRA